MIVSILLIIGAYLLGSIPSSVWIGKRFYGVDVREHGSKNAGTTNTLRVLGRRAALPVFIIDLLKGLVAVSLAHFATYESEGAIFNFKILLIVVAVVGHIFPLFARFKGGKGVATLTGAVFGLYLPASLICLAVFAVVLALTHYVSLSSMSAGLTFPIAVIGIFGERQLSMVIFSIVLAVALILTHRKNIYRLRTGTESKTYLGRRRKQP